MKGHMEERAVRLKTEVWMKLTVKERLSEGGGDTDISSGLYGWWRDGGGMVQGW